MKTFQRALAIVMASLFVTSTAVPAMAQQNVKGIGWYSCGEIGALFDAAGPVQAEQIESMMFSWVQGYATAKNLDRPEPEQRDLTDMNPESVIADIDRVCTLTDTARLYMIAEEIYLALPPLATSLT